MTSVNFDELGFKYIWEVMKNYFGTWTVPVIFLISLVIIAAARDRKARFAFLYPVLVCVLTVYNPLVANFFIDKLDVQEEFYRFFWILPVAGAVGYGIVKTVELCKIRPVQVAVAAGLLFLVGWGFNFQETLKNFPDAPSNIYKVGDDILAESALIHEDSTKENPNLLVSTDYETMVLRQYDPSIFLVLNRDYILNYYGVGGISVNKKGEAYKAKKILMDVMFGNLPVEKADFCWALDYMKTDYISLKKEAPQYAFIIEAGWEAFADTGEYILFRPAPENEL